MRAAATLSLPNAADLKLTPVTNRKGRKQVGASEVGKLAGYLAKYRVQVEGTTYDRYVQIAAAPAGDYTVAVFCECEWKRRDYWEQEAGEVVGSLRAAAK